MLMLYVVATRGLNEMSFNVLFLFQRLSALGLMYLRSSWLLLGLNAVPHVPAERSCRCRPASTWGSPTLSLLGQRDKTSLSSKCPARTQRWLKQAELGEHKGTNNGHTMGMTTPESPRGCRASEQERHRMLL